MLTWIVLVWRCATDYRRSLNQVAQSPWGPEAERVLHPVRLHGETINHQKSSRKEERELASMIGAMEEEDREWTRWGERRRRHALASVKLFKLESIYENAMSLVRQGARPQHDSAVWKPRQRQSPSQLTSNIFIGSPVTFNLTCLFCRPAKCPLNYHLVKVITFWPHFQTPSQINTKAGGKKNQREEQKGWGGPWFYIHRSLSEACVMMCLFKEHLKWKARTILFDRWDSLFNGRREAGQGQQTHRHAYVHAGLATNVQRGMHRHKLQEHLQRGFPALSMWSRGVGTDVEPSP